MIYLCILVLYIDFVFLKYNAYIIIFIRKIY